jgi:cell pole-organizing protein PopZ
MEEILASIRRIIAEGEREAQEGGGERDRTDPPAAAQAGPAAESVSAETVQAEVLVLTEMVQDDGSVVSLPPDPAPAESEGAEPADKPLTTVSIEEPLAVPSTGPEPTAAELVPPWMRTDPTPTFVATPPIESPGPPKSAEPTTTQTTPSPDKERIAVPAEGSKKPELVSEEALAASTAALSQLAQSVSRTREPTPGQSKTVEEVVREAVEPMLKTWLDTNLPRIVERMVREAIDRVVRRVE